MIFDKPIAFWCYLPPTLSGIRKMNIKKKSQVVTVLFLIMLVRLKLEAANLYVPRNYPTIQAAVNAAYDGDTIYVDPGTYTEAISIDKGIALVGIEMPTINPPSYKNAVTFNGNDADGASISKFKITNATGRELYLEGSGIWCNSSSPIITDNIITMNNYGLICNNSSPTIINNTITKNSKHGSICYNSSSPTITNNIIIKNGVNGISSSNSLPIISNNIIAWNTIDGINCSSFSFLTITNNIVIGNNMYGIWSDNFSTLISTYNNIYGNTVGNYYNCQSENDISNDPMFIGSEDYHLHPSSLCIDAGTNTASHLSLTDMDGKPRIVNEIVDIGAYEYQGPFGTITGCVVFDLQRINIHEGINVMVKGWEWGTATTDIMGYFTIPEIPLRYGTVSAYAPGTSVRMWNNIPVPRDNIVTLETLTLLNADANGDSVVDYADFTILAGAFFHEIGESAYLINADFNGDGRIDTVDFSYLLVNFGTTQP